MTLIRRHFNLSHVQAVRSQSMIVGYCVQLDPVNSKSHGERKWFELTGVQINEVKISSKALQGEGILLRISEDFELSEFKLSGFNCIGKLSIPCMDVKAMNADTRLLVTSYQNHFVSVTSYHISSQFVPNRN